MACSILRGYAMLSITSMSQVPPRYSRQPFQPIPFYLKTTVPSIYTTIFLKLLLRALFINNASKLLVHLLH